MKSIRVTHALKKLGADLADARKRRRISTTLMAQRMGITRQTLANMENGSATVAMGTYATALMILAKLDDLAMLVDRSKDTLGLDLTDEALPKRIRLPKAMT